MEIISTDQDFNNLGNSWNELLQDSQSNQIFLQLGWLRICRLNIAEEIAAINICIYYSGIYSSFQTTNKQDFRHLSPGLIMLQYVIHTALLENAQEFDLG